MAINILFTSAGRRVELLSLFREAYQALQLAGTIVALDIDPLAPALRIADRHYIVPKFTDPNYVPSIVEICRREQIHMVFPLIDPDIPVLTSHRAAIEATGARLATVSALGAGLTGDKWESVQFFQRLGLAAPQSWLPSTLDPDAAEYPLFIKPRCGSAAKDTFKVKNARELRFFMDYVNQPIIQEFLPGPEITSDVICDLQGETLAVVSRRRIEVRWGEVAKGVTVYDADISSACVRIARELQAMGPITVQCIMKQGRPYFNEVNARLGGGAPLGVHAGSDWPRWLLARAAGMACEPAPLGTYKTGVFLTRFDDSYFLTEADCDKSCHL
jgi:carbamoyl-phosphate synthase large subunit